ncbi:unnamed protein product [Peniophora sp. CBMAI 1063]|nr:unnamed protein product [Peniophora sp. CBMAI 1063]
MAEAEELRHPGRAATDAKAETVMRGLLASYSYRTPTATPGPQALPRRSPRNLTNMSTAKRSDTPAKLEPGIVTLPITPVSLAKRRVTPTSSSRKRKHEAVDDDYLPLPPPLKRHPSAPSSRSKAQKKQKRGYAAPETYAHLNGLPDHLGFELDVLFCGINPGYKSAESGAHYAHPANHFWRCLHQGGFTPTRISPSDGYLLPEKYNIGLTNIVERPSAEAKELSKAEIEASVQALLDKVRCHRPRVVCFVGKLVWDAVVRVLAKLTPEKPTIVPKKGKSAKTSSPFIYEHLQPYKLVHTGGPVTETLFFVVPSTSGRVVSHQLNDKIVLFLKLKEIVGELQNGACDTSAFAALDVSTFQLPGGLAASGDSTIHP